MVCHHTVDSFQDITNEEEEEEEEEEDFPTAPLHDDVWLQQPVPDRHLCIHEQSQPHDLCPYPCQYSLDQLHPSPGSASTSHYKMMDLSDTFDFPDVMKTTKNEDISHPDDVFGP